MIHSLKIVERLTFITLSVIFLFLMHLSIPNMGGTVAHPREYFVWIGLFTLVLLSIIKTANRKTFISPSYLKYFAAYIILILSTGIFNPVLNMDIFVINLLRLIAALIIWLSLHQLKMSSRDKENLLLLIFVSSVIESILVSFKFYVSSYHVHALGINLAMKIAKLTKYIPDVGGAFQQKNLYASWTATGIAIGLYFITTERFTGYKIIKKVFIYFSILLLSAGLMLASSRAGLVGAALAMIILLPTNWRGYSGIKKHLAIWMIVFALGISGGLYLRGTKGGAGSMLSTEAEAKERIDWLSNTSQRSFAERLIMYDTSYEMFRDKPFFGQGFSNFGSLFMYYKARISEDNPLYKGMVYTEFISHPHNEFFYILAECGIAGILAIIIAFYGIGRILFRSGIRNAGISIALLSPLLLHMMVEYPLKLSTLHYFVFLILLYFITTLDTKEKEIAFEKMTATAILIAAGILYAGLTSYTIKTYNDYIMYSEFKLIYMNTGIISERDIVPANKNIYLRNWAEPDYMFRKALQASFDPPNNMKFINEFLLWNEEEKQRRPGLPSYNLEALIFYKSGQADPANSLAYFEKARTTSEEGLKLYPNDGNLISMRQKIIDTAIGSFLK